MLEKTLTATTKAFLRSHLEGEGNFILEIRRVDGLWSRMRGGRGVGRVKMKDFLSFNQELSVLLKAGLPIISALDAIIEKGGRGEFMAILKEIRNDVSGGESLSGAFDRFSHVFSKLYVASLQAGEKSGNVISALSRHVEYIKKIAAVKRRVVSASIYPAILSFASVAALLFLLTYVVPNFMKTYLEAGTPLPGITLFLVRIGQFLSSNVQTLVLVAALGFGFFFVCGEDGKGPFSDGQNETASALPGKGLPTLHPLKVRQDHGNGPECGKFALGIPKNLHHDPGQPVSENEID